MKPNIWIEKTLVKNRPDRQEGELAVGKAIWSPQRDKGQRDVYSKMREVREGDVVLHLIDNSTIRMVSIAAAGVDETFKTPANTEWGGRPGYIVPLKSCIQLDEGIPRSDIFTERNNGSLLSILNNHQGLFFNRNFEFNQGSYLTKCPEALATLLNAIYQEKSGKKIPHLDWVSEKLPLGNLARPIKLTFIDTAISRALLSKPFLILTGPSGTGKTRGAIQLAESLCDEDCRAVVAVGADWTDNRHVVGFLNPLQTMDGTPNGKPIYETTAILNLLLHANAQENRDKPHVLILDEMNLSHVERYFADFLSAMELDDKQKALKLHTAGLAKTREGEDVEGCIDFPENLFVIGTVNIDETTYMFSPKVLDRANVIEIHADSTELRDFLRDGTEQVGAEAKDYGISFLDLAREIRCKEPNDGTVPLLPSHLRIAAADRLMELFEIMKRGRGEFGFRTGREVLAYLRTAYFLTQEAERAAWAAPEGDWLKALDAQILQKILPKLHGSRTRLAPLLGALAQYCATGTKAYAMEHFPEGVNSPRRGLIAARNIPNPKFKHSYKKLERMIEVLVEEQFVSFIC